MNFLTPGMSLLREFASTKNKVTQSLHMQSYEKRASEETGLNNSMYNRVLERCFVGPGVGGKCLRCLTNPVCSASGFGFPD
eukprot:5264688-Amphidinium_carterae.1